MCGMPYQVVRVKKQLEREKEESGTHGKEEADRRATTGNSTPSS